jgi:hypothetical protein
MSRNLTITQQQYGAAAVSRKLAEELFANCDALDLVGLFVKGNGREFSSLKEMAEYLQTRYANYRGYTESIMVSGLSLALRRRMGDTAYFAIADQRRKKRARDLVDTLLDRGERMGILEISDEDRKKAGKKGGDKIVREKLGAHGVQGEARHNMFVKMVKNRGQVPLDDEERDTELGPKTAKGYILALKSTGVYEYRDGWDAIYDKLRLNGFAVGADRKRFVYNLRSYYFRWKQAQKGK